MLSVPVALLLLSACSETPTGPGLPPIDPNAIPIEVGPVGSQYIQAAIDAHPEGTSFRLVAGSHVRQSIAPKNGNSFFGELGPGGERLTILDGENETNFAFRGDADHVRIQNLVIRDYDNPDYTGAVHAGLEDGDTLGRHWTVQNNEISGARYAGVDMGPSMRLLDNEIVRNGVLGMTGGREVDLQVIGNEIAYNNTRDVYWGEEAGGVKFVRTINLTVRDNFVHHNRGPGLWCDIDNRGALYEGNLVEDNEGPGIFHEISFSAIIRNNTVRRNGTPESEFFFGAGILVSGSNGVDDDRVLPERSGVIEITGNLVEDNQDGIVAIDQGQEAEETRPHPFPYHVRNVWVHHNEIHMSRGQTGLHQDWGQGEAYTQWNNRFECNEYVFGEPNGQHFTWEENDLTWSQWRQVGNDRCQD